MNGIRLADIQKLSLDEQEYLKDGINKDLARIRRKRQRAIAEIENEQAEEPNFERE